MTFKIQIYTVLALTLALSLGRGDEPKNENVPKAPLPPKVVVDEVTGLAKKLGNESFRERRKATKRLLEIARFARPDGGKAVIPYKQYVCERLKELLTHDDPEVSQRAREIIAKLHPKPTIDWSKFVKLPHFVDQQNDTLETIAEMYGSKTAWIKAANPGLKTDKDLRMRKEIQIPVEDLGIE